MKKVSVQFNIELSDESITHADIRECVQQLGRNECLGKVTSVQVNNIALSKKKK